MMWLIRVESLTQLIAICNFYGVTAVHATNASNAKIINTNEVMPRPSRDKILAANAAAR
jgi:hypothetical protein